jgi:hypothetical protein
MSHGFVFLIRPLSVERGFELDCEGVIEEPLQVHRLIEAVIAAAQIGQGLDAEIQILDSQGEVAEVLQLNGSTVAMHLHQQQQHLQHA